MPCVQCPLPSPGTESRREDTLGSELGRICRASPQMLPWEPSSLSHPPGLSPSHLSSRGITVSPPFPRLPPPPPPMQQGLPEGWEDTVVVVPGGCQVGPTCVGRVQAPCSLVVCGKGKGKRRHQRGFSAPTSPLPLRQPRPWAS